MLRALHNYIGLRRCRIAVSGAAPIATEVLHFFRVLGVSMLEVYGMTETAGLVTCSAGPTRRSAPSVNRRPGIEVRSPMTASCWCAGRRCSRAITEDEQATREAIDADGWLHTGDVAADDGDEMRIVDRKKDIMITAGGKNITPRRSRTR